MRYASTRYVHLEIAFFFFLHFWNTYLLENCMCFLEGILNIPDPRIVVLLKCCA